MSKRFLHISDIHIGITLCGMDLTDDLRHILLTEIAENVLDRAEKEKHVDGIIAAGDIFDRETPSAEAEALWGEFLGKMYSRGVKVYCTSGNHDSAVRLASLESVIAPAHLYIPKPFSRSSPYRVERLDEVDIVMLPYITMSMVKAEFPEAAENIKSTAEAVKYVLDMARQEPGAQDRPHILAAHQAVGAAVGREAGAQQMIPPSVFEGFAYTALGHFHSGSNPCGAENVRYCGSPLCFSQNEANRSLDAASPVFVEQTGGSVLEGITEKAVDVIDIADDGSVSVSHIPLAPKRRVIAVRGTYEDIMAYYSGRNTAGDYFYIVLTSSDVPGDFDIQLRKKFPLNLSVRVDEERGAANSAGQFGFEVREDSFRGDFAEFFRQRTGGDIPDEVLSAAEYIFELTKKASRDGTLNKLCDMYPAISEDDEAEAQENGGDV